MAHNFIYCMITCWLYAIANNQPIRTRLYIYSAYQACRLTPWIRIDHGDALITGMVIATAGCLLHYSRTVVCNDGWKPQYCITVDNMKLDTWMGALDAQDGCSLWLNACRHLQ